MSHKRGLAAAACAAFLAIAAGGCDGSSTTTTTTTTPPPGCSASTSSTAVGAVCSAQASAEVMPAGGTPNTVPGNGTPLYKKEVIATTDANGRVNFWIDIKITECFAYHGGPTSSTAKLVVWPPQLFAGHQILIDYQQGYVTCGTTQNTSSGITLGVNGVVYITTKDPVWTVEVDSDGTIKIRVYVGVVNVGRDPQHMRPVNANQEIVIEPNGTVEPPHAFKPEAMSRAEQDAVTFLGR